ncbi:MAG: multidrug transporter AcrB, partial [Novosphingobium sp. 16-62-11]
AGLQRLDIVRGRPINVSIVEVALVSDLLPMHRLEKLADSLRERLGTIPGINEAKYWGAGRTEMRVALDMARLAALRLPPAAVAEALRAAGQESPIGAVNAGDRRFTVKYGGAFRSPEAIAAVPLVAGNGRALRVGDVATVGWAQDEPDHITRFNGQRALLITATQGKDQDVTRLSAAISAELDAFEQTLPGGVKLVRGFDQSENVKHRIGGLTRDFLIALALVSLTLLPLGLRAAGVVMIAIPLSLLIGVAILAGLGFTLNQLAIAGFVLALGILVDDAIVEIENIVRHMRMGKSAYQASIDAADEIGLAVVATTFSIVAVFLPVGLMPGVAGQFFKNFGLTVVASVLMSLAVARMITPMIAAYFLKSTGMAEHGEASWIDRYMKILRWSL